MPFGEGGHIVNKKPKWCKQCGAQFSRSGSARYCEECVPYRGVKGHNRWYLLIRNYGVDKVMFDAMYFEQDGECAICRDREATHVDHCHSTGKVRGLLCNACNKGIGLLREDTSIMTRAMNYISDGRY